MTTSAVPRTSVAAPRRSPNANHVVARASPRFVERRKSQSDAQKSVPKSVSLRIVGENRMSPGKSARIAAATTPTRGRLSSQPMRQVSATVVVASRTFASFAARRLGPKSQ